jgi:HAD superfamily hydrolase (TIGR01549 family)
MTLLTLAGLVTTGLGQGASFTQLEWARRQFIYALGIDPYPGTLNLNLAHPADLATWISLKTEAGVLITPPDPAWYQARAYPVRVAERFPAAIILPEAPHYPATQVEVLAAVPLRQALALSDGDLVSLQVARPLPVRAVIFDVDGTLVDTVEAYRVVAALAAEPYGLRISQDMIRRALNNNHPTFWELVTPADYPNRAQVMELMKREAMQRWPEVLQQYGRIIPNLAETLGELHCLGIRLGIVTGSQSGSFQLLQADGLLDYFEVIITGADVNRPKPDPEGLLKCLAALGVAPSEAAYVGDTPVDVQTCRAAGTAAVAVLSGAGDAALLSLAGPDWLIYSHKRVPEIILPIVLTPG